MGIDLQEFAVRGDKEGRMGKGGNDIWMYWRIPERTDEQGNVSHARIVGKPAWPVEFMRQVRKGMTPLPLYGEFFPERMSYKGQSWQYQSNPYRLILLKGGAHEFSAGQVMELGWHRRPPLKGIEFPQLAGVDQPAHVCATCRKIYNSVEDLQSHESIAHATLSSHKALGRQLAEATQGVMAGSNDAMAQALTLLAGAVSSIGNRLDDLDKRLPPAPESDSKPQSPRR
jgi:hypothetical protein